MPLRDIVGHGPLIRLLTTAVVRGRVPQSLLFAGPGGVGKRTTAVALAQAVNCPTASSDACGVCPTCQRIAKGQHSDVVVIDRGEEASIKIRVLRERLLDVVGYRPFEAKRRVYIIDGAEDMTNEGQDALLKTLEEPPSASILVLVSAYPDVLLPTIQSRCRRLRFGPLSEQDVERVLVSRCLFDAAQARQLAPASGGSVARALAEELGDAVEDREAALNLLTAATSRGVQPRLSAAAKLVQHDPKRRSREAVGARLAMAASILRDLAALAADRPLPLANADLESKLRQLKPAFDVTRAEAAFDAIGEAQDALDRNGSAKIVADWIALAI